MDKKSILKKVGIIACAVLISVVSIGAYAAFTKHMEKEKAQQPTIVHTEPVLTNSSAQTINGENYISETEAIVIALTHANVMEADASHMFSKLDYDDGIAEYEVEFWDGEKEYDYEINAVTGEIISYDYEMESYNVNSTAQLNSSDYISETEAKTIALNHANVMEADASHMFSKLDYDDGIAEYEVEFWDGEKEYDYEINAVTGEIISYDYEMESYNVNSTAQLNSSDYISETEAKTIALTHANVTESEAGSIRCEFDFDDGVAEYEIEWKIGLKEYEYTIRAVDGVILEQDIDFD